MQCIAVVLLVSDNTLHNTCMHEVPCMSSWMFGWVLISLWLVGVDRFVVSWLWPPYSENHSYVLDMYYINDISREQW